MKEKTKDRLYPIVFWTGLFCVVIAIIVAMFMLEYEKNHVDGMRLGFNWIEEYNPKTGQLSYSYHCDAPNKKCIGQTVLPDWCKRTYDPKAKLVIVQENRTCMWFMPSPPASSQLTAEPPIHPSSANPEKNP
ncbi:MAG: hypothetical protein ABH832_01545 [bacterium]